MSINPELSIKDEKREEEDRQAKQRLDALARPMEQRFDQEHREYVQSLLEDMQKDYVLEDINVHEADEYLVVLKHRNTGQVKTYAFEAPLSVVLPSKSEKNLPERMAKLYQHLFDATSKFQ